MKASLSAEHRAAVRPGLELYSIGKRFDFAAARRGRDGRLIGRTFVVEAELTSRELVGPGFVCDFGDLAPLRAYVDRTWDHRVLNEVVDWSPTDSALASYLTSWFRGHVEPSLSATLQRVRVWEDTPGTREPTPRWWFGAAHHLPSLPATHKCSRPHGHSFLLDVELVGDESLQAHLLATLTDYVRTRLHDHDLNDVLDVEPTSEHLAAHVGRLLRGMADDSVTVAGIAVWEGPRSWAACRYDERPEAQTAAEGESRTPATSSATTPREVAR